MKRFSSHSLPPGRLKEEDLKISPTLISRWTVRRRTRQCFSIIVAFITVISVAAAEVIIESSSSTTFDDLSTWTRIGKEGDLATTTATRSSGAPINSLEATVASLVSNVREEVKQVESTTLGIEFKYTQLVVVDEKKNAGTGGHRTSTVPEAFTWTTTTSESGNENGGTLLSLSSLLGEEKVLSTTSNPPAMTTTRTRIGYSVVVGHSRSSLGDESPQSDQPSGDDGSDVGIGRNGSGGYYHGQNEMSNGKLGNGLQRQQNQEEQRDDGSAVMVQSSEGGGAVNIDNDNGRGFNDMDIQCPSLTENSACPCYKFDDGLFLECPGTTAFSLRTTLQLITAPIQSLSVYDFDRSVTKLTQDVFSSGKLHIRHLQFSQSHLQLVEDNALRPVSNSLESLSIVNGKLSKIPQKAISGLDRLTSIDFEANEVKEVPAESFAGLHLAKLNLKSNRIETIQANAFQGVEMTLSEIDLSDNKLRAFPLVVLRQLDNLRSLQLALNEMSALLWDGHTRLQSLQFLDLSSNKFTELGEHFFHPFGKLKTLSLYSNALRVVYRKSFQHLKELVSIDISHNYLTTLDPTVFQSNKKLQTIDLSHNHLHYVDDMFTNLPFLREVFLSGNNILELSRDVFTNSTRITLVYLEQNAIRRLDDHLLETLPNLQQLHLSNSFIASVGVPLFRSAAQLTSLSLDGNWLEAVERGLFTTLTHLRELRLHGNRIRQIQRNVFQPLPALVELHLQHNLISDIEADAFATLTNLMHLNLQHNRLLHLEVILPRGPNTALTSVQLDGNRLTTINEAIFRGQRHLQTLWLGNNQLTTLNRELLADVVGVENLNLSNNSIEKIHGDSFQSMTALRLLDLSGNSLTEVKRSHFSPHLVNLEELVLRANRIQTVEVSSFEKLLKLRVLDLSENFITKLTKDMFQDELQITSIALQGSRVSHIEAGTFRNMNTLYELNLEGNALTAEDVRQLEVPSLRELRLSNNLKLNDSVPVTVRLDGMFDKLPSLQILRMVNCNIHELPELIFTRNTNLVRIDLSGNHLKSLPRNMFSGLNVLKELRLRGNQFTEFPHLALFNCSALETLSMGENQLTSIDVSKLNGVPSLRSLDLSGNLISSMSGFSAINVTQLESVDLSGNYLLALPSNFFFNSLKINRVDLSRNRFQHIPSNGLGDNTLPGLSWLDLSGNPLTVFYNGQQATVKFSFLQELHIRHTNLTIVTSQDFQAFPGLQKLYLMENKINRISPGAFNGLRSLLTLDVSVNELEKVPKERLQGLRLLRTLNLSHNVLKDLDEFSEDLAQVRQLDLSFNQLAKLTKNALRNLVALNELHLAGNRLKSISGESFRNVHQLQWLDLRRNNFEHIPLAAVQMVEAQLKALKIEDNPIQCSCDTQELWEWLRNHLKLILPPMNRNSEGESNKQKQGPHWISSSRPDHTEEEQASIRQRLLGSESTASSSPDELLGDEGFVVIDGMDDSDAEYSLNHLRCDQPTSLRGRNLMDMEPHQFCNAPLILKVAIQDIQPYTVFVSWQTREHSGLLGYHVVYRTMEGEVNEVRSVTLDRWATSAKLFKLTPGTQYQICVVGIGNWGHKTTTNPGDLVKSLSSTSYYYSDGRNEHFNARNRHHLEQNALETLLRNNVTSKCQEVVTLDAEPSLTMDEHGLAVASFIRSLLTRRLGLIVGCCLGIIVFIVLVSVLGWLKVKKQRLLEESKRMEPMPPDFISYREYSLPTEEQHRILQTGVDIGQDVMRHQSYDHQGHGGAGGGRAVYISRNEMERPLMRTSTEDGCRGNGSGHQGS